MMRVGDMRPGAQAAEPARGREDGRAPEEISPDTRRRLLESAERLVSLGCKAEYKAIVNETMLKALKRQLTVGELINRIESAVTEAERKMLEAKADLERLRMAWAAWEAEHPPEASE